MTRDEAARAAIPPGGWIEAYVRWADERTDAPTVYHLGTAFSILSLAVDPDVDIYFGGRVTGPYWSLLVGDAGDSRKTSAANLGMDILEAACPAKIAEPDHESVGAFMEHMAEKDHSILYYPEYGDWLSGTKQGSYKADLRERSLRLWDGRRIAKNSKSAGLVEIERPRISQLACVAPSLLENHTTEHDWTDGGMSRWSVYYAERQRLALPFSRDRSGQQRLVEGLRYRIDVATGECLGLDEAATARFAAWVRELDAAARQRRNRWIAPTLARIPTMALKAALVLAVDCGNAHIGRGRPWKLGEYEVYWGIQQAQMTLGCAIALQKEITMTPYARKRRAVLDAVQGALRPLPDILRRVTPPMPKKEVETILDSLVAEQRIVKVAHPGAPVSYSVDTSLAGADARAVALELGEAARAEDIAAEEAGPAVSDVGEEVAPATVPAEEDDEDHQGAAWVH